MRPAPDDDEMRDRRARGVQRGHDVERVHPLPGLGIAVRHRLEGEAAGDVDQRIELAEMRRGGIDCFPGLGRIGQVDAAEFEQISRGRGLRRRMIDACNPGAPRQRFVHDHPAERTQRARHDNDFSVHEGLRTPGKGSAPYQEFFTAMRRISAWNDLSHAPKLPRAASAGGSELRKTTGWGRIDKICRSSVSRFQNPFGTTGYQQKGRGICHGFAGSWFTACSA